MTDEAYDRIRRALRCSGCNHYPGEFNWPRGRCFYRTEPNPNPCDACKNIAEFDGIVAASQAREEALRRERDQARSDSLDFAFKGAEAVTALRAELAALRERLAQTKGT